MKQTKQTSPTKIHKYSFHPIFAMPMGPAKVVRNVANHSPKEDNEAPMCRYRKGGISTLYVHMRPAVQYPNVNTKIQMTAKAPHCVPVRWLLWAISIMKTSMAKVSI